MNGRVLVVALSLTLAVAMASSSLADGCWKFAEDYNPKPDPFAADPPLQLPNVKEISGGIPDIWTEYLRGLIGPAPAGRCDLYGKVDLWHEVRVTKPKAPAAHNLNRSFSQGGAMVKRFQGWQADQRCARPHGAPTDARSQGNAVAQGFGALRGNADNGAPAPPAGPLGHAACNAYAEVTFVGVEAGHVIIDLNGEKSEGNPFIGPLTFSLKETGQIQISGTITPTLNDDAFFVPTVTKTCNLTYTTPSPGANIGADSWTVAATVTAAATCLNRAAEAFAEARTEVQSFNFFLNDGGTGTSCEDGSDHWGHGFKRVPP